MANFETYPSMTYLMKYLTIVTNITERHDEGRVRVMLLGRAAIYYAALNNELLLDMLRKSLLERIEIQLDFDADTLEILRADYV